MNTEQVNQQRRWNADQALRLRAITKVVAPRERPDYAHLAENFLTGFMAARGARSLWNLFR